MINDQTLEDMDEKARELLYGGGLDEDDVEAAMMRLHLVLRDAVGDKCSESSRPTVEQVLRGVVDTDVLDDGHLHSYAAQSAARELIASWMDVVCEGCEGPDSYDLTRMMVVDIDETIAVLRRWKAELVSKP